MKHLTEEQLDIYINSRDLFSEEDIISLEHHLQHCGSCRELYHLLSDFYIVVDEAQPKLSRDYVSDVSQDNPSSYVHELLPCSYHSENDYSNGLIIFAADSQQQSKRFEEAAVYKTENKKIVLKIIRDNEKKHFRFYVLGEPSLLKQRILLHIENINTTIVTNHKGQAIIDAPETTADFNQQLGKIYLHIPKYSVHLKQKEYHEIDDINSKIQKFGLKLKRSHNQTIEVTAETHNSIKSHLANYLVTESASGMNVFTQDELFANKHLAMGSTAEDIAIYIYH